MERALLPRLRRALGLCRCRSSRGPAGPSGAGEGAPGGRVPPSALPQGPAAAPGEPRGQSAAGRGPRSGTELRRAGPGAERAPPALQSTKGSEILFGVAPCSLALSRARRALFRLFLRQGSGGPRPALGELALQAAARGVPVLRVPRRALDALSRGRPHQGVCLEASPLRFQSLRAEEPRSGAAESGTRPLWLALEHIQDPMNLGALLRSAYFLGVDRVVTSRRNSCPLTPTVSKASAGAMEVFDVYSTDDLQGFLKAKSAEGWEVVGTVSKAEDVEDVPVISCLEFQWNKPLILVLGSEGEGLSLESQLLCHQLLAIPPGRALHPGIDSLNVSVAAGILLHSICSQKRRHRD